MARTIFLKVALALALSVIPTAPAGAQTFTWNGGGTNWNSASNWLPVAIGIPNSPSALVNFTGIGTFYSVNISASVSAQSLTFSNPTLGYSLTSSAGQILSGLTTINVGASVTEAQTINLANIATGSLLFTGSGPGALTITNDGPGTLFGTPLGTLVIGSSTVIGTPGSGGITVGGSGHTTISGSFASNASPNNQVIGGITKTGTGTLTMAGSGVNLFGGTTLTSGQLVWDYFSNPASKLGGGNLTLTDGYFRLNANQITAVTQSVAGTSVGSGDIVLSTSTNSGALASLTLNLGAIARVSTGTLTISRDAGSTITTTTALTNGILGGWVTDGLSTWATKSGSNIVGLSTFGTNVYAPGVNTDVTTGAGIPSGFTTNTLRFNSSVPAVLSGTNTFQSGGILTSSAASGASMTGGTLASGTGELLVHTHGDLTITSANIAGGLVKTGQSTLTFGGQIGWLGGGPLTINRGVVRFTDAQAFDTLTDIRFNNHTDFSHGVAIQLADGQNAASNASIRLTGNAVYDPRNPNSINNYAVNSRITLAGPISTSSGAASLFFANLGSDSSGFNLTGANTFTGNVTVVGGILGIASDSNLGSAGNALLLYETSSNIGGLEFLNDGVSLAHSLQIPSSGRIIVTGTNTNSINSVISGSGSLNKVGTGALVLNNAASIYSGGTNVNQGRLQLGIGTAIPTGTNVTVASGAEFNIGSLSNSAASAIGTLTLNGGTFRVPSGNGDYYLNKLAIGSTGGTVDFAGTSNFRLHLTGSGAGITFASDSTWTGAGTSRIQNDTAAPIDIFGSTFLPTLTNGIILANGINSQGFRLTGPTNGNFVATMMLTNPGNTANLIANSAGYLKVADMAHLGSGSLTLQNTAFYFRPGTLWYVGATASSSKPITLGIGGGQIYVNNDGTNLTLSGTIGESSLGQPLLVTGNFTFPSPPTLTLTGANTFTGAVTVAYFGTLSVGAIPNGGLTSPLGRSSSAPANLKLGHPDLYGGTLHYTGPTATTDRGMTLVAFANSSYTNVNAVAVTSAATNLTIAGQVTGTGGLSKTGPGTLTLNGVTNNYAGGTFVDAGRLALGSGNAIPAGSNVNVAFGAEFNTGGLTNGGGDIGTVFLNGGTLRIPPPAATAYYYLNKVVTNGGTIDFTGDTTSSGVVLTNAGAGVTVNGNSTWTGPNSSFIGNSSFAERPITIAPFATLTSSLSLASFGPVASNSFRITGGGTLHLTNTPGYVAFVRVNQGRLRMDDLTGVQPNFFNLTLDAGTLAYGGPTVVSTASFALGAGGGTLEVLNAATTLDFNGQISGNETYPLTKTGPGTLILSSPFNFYSGGLIVNGGRLDAVGDYQLGLANPTVNVAGTLRYTANSTTERTFTLNNGSLEAPSGLTLNGATVNGGFLRGASTFGLTNGAALNGVTTFTSTNLAITGPASIANFAHNGNLTVSSGQSLAMIYATNASAGRMTVNGTANVTDFVSNGLLTVPNGGLINNTGSQMVLGGGSTTFVGAIGNLGGKIDLGGQQLLVRGGLLVTNSGTFGSGNGIRNGQTVADYGALVKGTGPYQSVITQNGGQYLPGNSPGTSQVGDFFINGGGNLIFQITDAGPSLTFPAAPGTAGTNPGWGLTQVFTSMNFTATPASPYTITMQTQLPPPAAPDTPGPMSSFDPNRAYQWLIFDLQPGAVFNGTFDPNAINFATAAFVNSTAGGTFSLARNGGQIFLTFTPVPEAEWILGSAAVALSGFSWWRRRKALTVVRGAHPYQA